jgi:SapC.
MTELLFYHKPAPLAKDKHRDLRYQKSDNYSFASTVNNVPVSGHEFFHCSRHYPVMFVETSAGGFLPVALLSITANSHQLGDRWEGVYVPAFVKRYPFALAENQDVVMIDEDAPHFKTAGGELLFDDQGEPTPELRDILEYLDALNKGHSQTLEYVKALKVKGLLSRCKSTVKLLDREVKLDSFFVVNEHDFQDALTDEEIVDWFNRGWLGWTYAHIHSIGAVNEILKRMAKAMR